MYTDPSGHSQNCGPDGVFCDNDPDNDYDYVAPGQSISEWTESFISHYASLYGIEFTGDSWTLEGKIFVLLGVMAVGEKLGSVLSLSGAEAFRATYGVDSKNTFQFQIGKCEECQGKGAFTHGSRHIEFSITNPFFNPGDYRSNALAFEMNVHEVIHELGHAFNDRKSSVPEGAVPSNLIGLEGFSSEPPGGQGLWTPQYDIKNESEAFANMFLGWVYGEWGNNKMGGKRAEFMTNMTVLADGSKGWAFQAAGIP